jgi:hypothetical protein
MTAGPARQVVLQPVHFGVEIGLGAHANSKGMREKWFRKASAAQMRSPRGLNA